MGGLQYQRPRRIEALDDLFADNLYAVRTGQRVSRRELAERTGIPFHSIEKLEVGGCRRGRRRVSIGEAVVLAEALGMKPGDLLRPPGVDRG